MVPRRVVGEVGVDLVRGELELRLCRHLGDHRDLQRITTTRLAQLLQGLPDRGVFRVHARVPTYMHGCARHAALFALRSLAGGIRECSAK